MYGSFARAKQSINLKSMIMGILGLNGDVKHKRILPRHAYHPNASLRLEKRAGYIAWPQKNELETSARGL
jgi:hypothetical protein